MKLHSEDPRLTAYLLGELPADDNAAVERSIAADPALQLAIKEIETAQRFLTDSLSPGSKKLLPRQRDQILKAARHADQSGKVTPLASHKRTLKPLIVPLAAAAIITLAIFLLLQLPSGTDPISDADSNPKPAQPGTVTLEIALLPAPGPPDTPSSADSDIRPAASSGIANSVAGRSAAMEENGDLFLRKVADRLAGSPPPEATDLPQLRARSTINTNEQNTLPLPVHCGNSSLAWITRSIREARKLPPANAVRLEEVLNQFALRPAGPASISQGVTLSTESISCPWKPSATLLLVSFRGANDISREVTASFQTDPSKVRRFRLMGFAPIPGIEPGPLPTRLPAGQITTLVIEVEPASPGADLGTIQWSVNGSTAPDLSLTAPGDSEPSDDARFAALVCTFCQWLSNRPAGEIDSDLLAALARETVSDTLPADRADFLNLIDQALHR